MKSTGIVRKVDELGRIVIPIELRRTMGIDEKDSLEIYIDEEKIILKKWFNTVIKILIIICIIVHIAIPYSIKIIQ